MIREWQDDGWRRRFALLPIYLSDGPNKQIIWLQWVWLRDMALYREVSLNDPRARDSDASLAEDASSRLSGEAVAARADEDGIAHTKGDPS